MTYINTEGLGNRPAWKACVIAGVLAVLAYVIGTVNADPVDPQWVEQTESEPVRVTLP